MTKELNHRQKEQKAKRKARLNEKKRLKQENTSSNYSHAPPQYSPNYLPLISSASRGIDGSMEDDKCDNNDSPTVSRDMNLEAEIVELKRRADRADAILNKLEWHYKETTMNEINALKGRIQYLEKDKSLCGSSLPPPSTHALSREVHQDISTLKSDVTAISFFLFRLHSDFRLIQSVLRVFITSVSLFLGPVISSWMLGLVESLQSVSTSLFPAFFKKDENGSTQVFEVERKNFQDALDKYWTSIDPYSDYFSSLSCLSTIGAGCLLKELEEHNKRAEAFTEKAQQAKLPDFGLFPPRLASLTPQILSGRFRKDRQVVLKHHEKDAIIPPRPFMAALLGLSPAEGVDFVKNHYREQMGLEEVLNPTPSKIHTTTGNHQLDCIISLAHRGLPPVPDMDRFVKILQLQVSALKEIEEEDEKEEETKVKREDLDDDGGWGIGA